MAAVSADAEWALDGPDFAQARSDRLFDSGDPEGPATWRQIRIAITELQRGRREGDAEN